jgi:hypothetical protein
MNKVYVTEELEVTINGIDWLVLGSISQYVAGIDDDGCERLKQIVCADNLYPIVIAVDGEQEVSDRPLAAYPIEWRDALIDAILDQASCDHERWDEERANR